MESSRRPSGLLLPPGVDPDDLDSIALQPQPYGINYVCPICGNRARNNLAGLEPVCTGPHPSLDEHEMTPMVRVVD